MKREKSPKTQEESAVSAAEEGIEKEQNSCVGRQTETEYVSRTGEQNETKSDSRFGGHVEAERASRIGTPAETKQASGKRIFGVRVSTLLLICYIAAFMGWCVENLFRLISIGVLDSRHQLFPFLAAYGFGIFVLYFVFGTPTEMRIFKKRILPENTKRNHTLRVVIYCSVVFVLILFGEMSVGLLFEKLFGVKAWNYLNIPLHITRYTSIPTTIGFTTGITLLMHFVFRPAIVWLENLPQKVAFWLALVLGIMIAADYLVMMIYGGVVGHFPEYWSIRFGR